MKQQKPDRFEARMRIQRLQLQWYKEWLKGAISRDHGTEVGKLIRSHFHKKN